MYFRAGVGAVIGNASGRVLACERADVPGSWQFPQGGLKTNETPAQAVLREVREETGIRRRDLELLDTYPQPLAYELPPDAWSAKTGRGQALYWFLFRLRDPNKPIDLKHADEFRAWRWMPFERMTRMTVDFRRPAYRQIYERFRPLLS